MKKLLSLLAVVSLTVACVDNDEVDLTGPKVVGFGSSFESVAYFADEGAVQREFAVNLIGLGDGSTSGEPIVVNYEIDTAASTATEGVEFNFVDSSGQITIPAGSTFGMFPLNVNTGQLNPTEKTQLVLKLTSASGETVVGEQFSTLRIVFVGCQSQLAPMGPETAKYTLVVTRNDGFVRNYADEDIYMYDINSFHTESTATYLQGQFAVPDQGFNFIDICGELTVPEQNLANFYSNLVRGVSPDGVDGFVIDENSFQLTYEVTFAAGNRTYTSVYTRNN